MSLTINVQLENNPQYGIVVSSRKVAQGLNKNHAHVLRDLDKILENPDLDSLFIPAFYRIKNQKRNYKEYLLTKDGFTLYMFNIQGYLDFKMAYIKRFNEMEKALSNLQTKSLPQPAIQEPITKPVRKTFHQRPVMTTQDLAWLLGCTRGSIHWYVSQTGMDFPVLTGEDLAHYKHENGKQDTASSLTVYSKGHVEMILKWHHLYDKHEAFLDEYFALEHSPHMGEEDMRIAVNQAYMLFRIAKEIKDPVVKEQNLKAVTALLINIGLWTEGCSGFDGVSAQWDINSAEGWNKMCVLQEAKKQWAY